jgi:hypothetical protein
LERVGLDGVASPLRRHCFARLVYALLC